MKQNWRVCGGGVTVRGLRELGRVEAGGWHGACVPCMLVLGGLGVGRAGVRIRVGGGGGEEAEGCACRRGGEVSVPMGRHCYMRAGAG